MALPSFVVKRPGRSVLLTGVALGLIGLLALVLAMGSTPTGDAEGLKKDLRGEISAEEKGLREDLAALNRDISSVDTERVGRDTAAGRTLVLALAGTSSSSLELGAQQAGLSARFEALGPTSRVLTEFLPEWLAATTAGGPRTYSLASAETHLGRVAGLDYSYTVLARLDPAAAEDDSAPAPPEFVLLRYTTSADGRLSGVDAWRAAPDTRDSLLGTDGEDTNDPTTTPTPTTTGSSR